MNGLVDFKNTCLWRELLKIKKQTNHQKITEKIERALQKHPMKLTSKEWGQIDVND